MLAVVTIQNRAPVTFVVLLKGGDNSFHRSFAGVRTYPELVRLLEVGRHQRMMERVIRKQSPEANTRGSKTE